MTTVLAPTASTPAPGPTLDRTPRSFRPDVEGLRAVAVGLVVLYHAGVGWIPGGYVGVDVFFVISGYLITGLLLREYDEDGRIALVDFYARRARRILPIACVVIIATVGASSIFLSSIRLDSIARDGLWTSVFGANFHFAASGADYLNATAPPSPLQHYWSLAVEEQFYVVWPLLLWLALSVADRRTGRASRNGRAAIIAGAAVVASIIWSIMQTSSDANAAYFSPFTRGWELGAGALVAICAVGLARIPRAAAAALGWIGLGLIVYSALVFNSRTPFPGSAALVPVLGSVCVLVGGLTLVKGGPEAVLATRPMQQIGRYSFSLYLLHWPILVLAEGRNPDIGLTTRLVLVVFSVGLSALTFHLLENPVRRMPRLTRSATASLLVGALAISSALVYSKMYVVGNKFVVHRAEQLFNLQNAGTDTSVPVTTLADVTKAVTAATVAGPVSKTVTPAVADAGTDRAPAYSSGCLASAVEVTSPDCTFGSSNSADPLVVLFGDTSAVQWSPALASLAAVSDFRFKIIAKEACPASSVTVLNPATNLVYPQCDTWRTWAFGELTRLKPSVVIVAQDRATLAQGAGSTGATKTSWAAGLTQTLTTLTALGSKVSVFSATPKHQTTAPACLTTNPTDVSQCADPIASSIPVADQAADVATTKAAGANYVDVTSWFCTTTVCPSVVNNMITAFDTSHVTVTYARYLADVVGSSAGIATGRRLLADADIKAAVAASATQKTSSSPLRPPATVAARDLSPAYANGCLVPARDTTSPTCTFGDGKATKKVVLFGDSHAAQWMPALLDVASRGGFSVTVLTKGNCPAPIMTVRNTAYQRDFTECDTWREWALKKVVELKPDLVVISSTFHGVALSDGVMQTPAVEAAWDAGLAALIRRMQVGSTKVTVVSDVANHVQRVPDCVAANPTNLLACATPVDQGTLGTHQRDETAAVLATGAAYLDVRPWFCDSNVCPSVIGGVITDFDDSHLTATYSKYLGHALGVALKLES